MKITFLMITFNTDFVLKEAIQSVLPYAHKFICVEGPVKYWQEQGYTRSQDDTVRILDEIRADNTVIVHGKWEEKTEMCQAGWKYVPEDTDYLWAIDSDEIFRPEDIEKTIEILENEKPSSVGFRSNSFFGGFDHIIGGFERRHSFKRILKYTPGCKYKTHRPPTLEPRGRGRDIHGIEMAQRGIEMFHYSYCSPRQVYEKIKYYSASVIKQGDAIENYFKNIWLPWVTHPEQRIEIENRYRGVHEFRYGVRGDAYTEKFTGIHPIELPWDKYHKQLRDANNGFKT